MALIEKVTPSEEQHNTETFAISVCAQVSSDTPSKHICGRTFGMKGRNKR